MIKYTYSTDMKYQANLESLHLHINIVHSHVSINSHRMYTLYPMNVGLRLEIHLVIHTF